MANRNSNDSNDSATNTNVPPNDQNGQNSNSTPPNPPTPDDPEFAGMSERERNLVLKARGEEKRKLYRKMREQEDRINEMQVQLRELQNAPPPRTPAQADSQDMRFEALLASLNTLTQQNQAIHSKIEQLEHNDRERTRAAELRAYQNQRIAEVRQNGDDLVLGLVGGDTEEQIDNSIKIAVAEYKLIIQQHEAKTRQTNQPTPTSVTVQSGNGRTRPTGTTPVQVPNSVEAEPNTETIDDLTSDSAIRSGEYAKHRTQLFGTLKRNYKYQGQQTQ